WRGRSGRLSGVRHDLALAGRTGAFRDFVVDIIVCLFRDLVGASVEAEQRRLAGRNLVFDVGRMFLGEDDRVARDLDILERYPAVLVEGGAGPAGRIEGELADDIAAAFERDAFGPRGERRQRCCRDECRARRECKPSYHDSLVSESSWSWAAARCGRSAPSRRRSTPTPPPWRWWQVARVSSRRRSRSIRSGWRAARKTRDRAASCRASGRSRRAARRSANSRR